jgi:hypothetical protein
MSNVVDISILKIPDGNTKMIDILKSDPNDTVMVDSNFQIIDGVNTYFHNIYLGKSKITVEIISSLSKFPLQIAA